MRQRIVPARAALGVAMVAGQGSFLDAGAGGAGQVMTKAEFAAFMNVSRPAVSQWITRRILDGEALVGEGRKAKINVAIAVDQVRRKRDLGQSLGNGIATRTEARGEVRAEPAGPTPDPAPPPVRSPDPGPPPAPEDPDPARLSLEDRLKAERLRGELMKNKRLAEEEALRGKALMPAAEARAEMDRIAGMLLQIFEGALPEMATAIAAAHGLPQRDVLHGLRQSFRKVRDSAARKETARRDGLQDLVSVTVDPEAAGEGGHVRHPGDQP